MDRFGVILPAAGSGTRFGGDKLFYEIDGHPVLWHTLSAFEQARTVTCIVIVTRKEMTEAVRCLSAPFSKVIAVTVGGADRRASVELGCAALPPDIDFISVHDAARPLITPQEIDRVHRIAQSEGAVCVCGSVNDTVHRVDADGYVTDTPPRAFLTAAQTPQIFPRSVYDTVCRTAHGVFTDDTGMACSVGVKVKTVLCECENFKITVPADAQRAAQILRARKAGVSQTKKEADIQ